MYFFCFCDLCILSFLYGIVWVLNINKYNSDFNCNESKYCILELKMEFWHKKPFSICFVHKSRKCSNFEPKLDYIMLRNFETIRPIFPKIAPKVAQDFVMKACRAKKKIPRNVEGGRIPPPPPPPGPFRVKMRCTNDWFIASHHLITLNSHFLHASWNIQCRQTVRVATTRVVTSRLQTKAGVVQHYT